MKPSRLVLFAAIAAGSAWAQTTTNLPRLAIVQDGTSADTVTIGVSGCNETIPLLWTNTLTFLLTNQCSQSPLKIWASEGSSCPESPGSNDFAIADVPSSTVDAIKSGRTSVRVADLPGFSRAAASDGGTELPCGSATPFTKTHVICGSASYALLAGISCATATKLAATPLKIIYDTQPPTAPKVTEYAAQDQAVRVGFTVDSDTSKVLVEARGPDDLDYVSRGETTASATYVRAEGLTNNVVYKVRLRAKDVAGNVSEASDPPIEVTPIQTLGFWGAYKQAGGTDAGGCSTGVGLAPLLLVAFALRRPRKQGEDTE
jgi:hypothetical protein